MRFSPFDFDVITTPEMPAARPIPRDSGPGRSSQTDMPRPDEPGDERPEDTADVSIGRGK